MTEKRFDAEALVSLLGESGLDDDLLYRFHLDGEADGIYLRHLDGFGQLYLPDEMRDMTGGLATGLVRHSKPLLALPCTLAELVAFEDSACVFRAHLEAGEETADLIREIASTNPDAGFLADALVHGEKRATKTDYDRSILADPGQLIDAFGRHTNMDASWFDKWKDHPALNNAIKRKGTSGRGHTTTPLFCPYLVMQGLMKPPRKGSKRKAFKEEATPWRMLRQHFPFVYDMHQGLSPLDD